VLRLSISYSHLLVTSPTDNTVHPLVTHLLIDVCEYHVTLQYYITLCLKECNKVNLVQFADTANYGVSPTFVHCIS